jgi:hypothetical protein
MMIRSNTVARGVILFALALSACGGTKPAESPEPEASAASEEPESDLVGTESSTTLVLEGVAGGVSVTTLVVEAEIVAIDREARTVRLKGLKGGLRTVEIGPEAVRFDELQVGDKVRATLSEEVAVLVNPQGEVGPDGVETAGARAEGGERPAGVVVQSAQLTAELIEINPTERTAVVRFEDGTTRKVQVRPDVKMEEHKVGEKIVIFVTDTLAIEVTPL